jgi:hypothetical protein
VLNAISVGKSFLIDAHINNEDVSNVRKCIYQSSTPKIKPGIIIIAFANQAANSIVL